MNLSLKESVEALFTYSHTVLRALYAGLISFAVLAIYHSDVKFEATEEQYG
jgi:hypothetical protein